MSLPFFRRREAQVPQPLPSPAEPPAAGTNKVPPRWAVALAAVVVAAAAVLVGTGRPVGMVLEALGGGGYVATEIVRRLNGGA